MVWTRLTIYVKENLLNIFYAKIFFKNTKIFLFLFFWIAVDISEFYRQNYFR